MMQTDGCVSQEIRASIRALAARELAAVERSLSKSHIAVHAERLADQYAGQVLYLVAWIGMRPVGHVLVRWRGTTNPALRNVFAQHGRHPYIEDLFVDAEYRSRTIGAQLLAMAEAESAQRDHRRVGLAVAIENVRARALYDRCGYQDANIGQFVSRWSYVDDSGYVRTQVEECVYLMKTLDEVMGVG